ncbi:MAG: trypsin-like peptidase domain-containing protein [Acetobacteraceae bacterium]|nr:trypsin-like peptidase domain-containing protein [Acetobacteraceae bacterium]
MRFLRVSAVAAMIVVGLAIVRVSPAGHAQSYRSAPVTAVDVPALVAELLPSVVNISTVRYEKPASGAANTPAARRSSLGSGFVIDPAGVILTNRHVIEKADEITVTFSDGTSLGATVFAAAVVDIALLKVTPAKPLPAVRWGDSFKLRQGMPVIAIGNPLGYSSSVTMGIVSALDRDINSSPYDDYVQTDASTNPGSSGGPLFNLAGEVVGVNSAIGTTSDTSGSVGIAFAIPSNDVQFVVNRLLKYDRIRMGWLAVQVQKVTKAVAEAVGLPGGRGVIVTSIEPDHPALAKVIWPGDVISAVDGEEVADARIFNRQVGQHQVGSIAALTIWRDGREMVVKVQIADNPQDIRYTLTRPARLDKPAADGRDLGLGLASLNSDARTRLKLTEDQPGLLLTTVEPFSPAAEQGLLAGDAILMVHRDPVSSVREFWSRMERAHAAGQTKVLVLVRTAAGDRWVALPVG